MTDANSTIQNEIASQDVVVFMKGTPQMPQCGFSGQVVQILNYLGVPFKGVNVLADQSIREGIKAFSTGRPSADLREGRVRRRLRHHPRDVPVRRAADLPVREGHPVKTAAA